jgi:hypothetical protein
MKYYKKSRVHSTSSAKEYKTGGLEMKRPEFYIEIDISSETYAVSVGTEPRKIVGKSEEFDNHPNGYTNMLAWLGHKRVQASQAIVCMEAICVFGEELARVS